MPIKDDLILSTAKELSLPEELVERVIMWGLKDAKEALLTNNQVEISGFGKFIVSPYKLSKRINVFEKAVSNVNEEIKEQGEKQRLTKRLSSATNILEFYKTKQCQQ